MKTIKLISKKDKGKYEIFVGIGELKFEKQ